MRYVWLLSLPGIFKTNISNIPCKIPYLSVKNKDITYWKKKLISYNGFRVGIVWAGCSRQTNKDNYETDKLRSMTLKQFEPLFCIPNIHFFNLQKDASKDQLKDFPAARIIDFMDEVDNFMDTAALISNLDLVIAVDTSIVHLVGALGKPVWMLSRYDGCWRWLLNRNDSPWYPTMKIYHQSNKREWGEVINHIRQDLINLKYIIETYNNR